MIMPGRHKGSTNYRFGYNGKEKDNEVKGEGNSLDFGARMLDTRLGRWMSLDNLAPKYVSTSPYVFALNSPEVLVDPDGNDIYWINSTGEKLRLTRTAISKIDNISVREGFAVMMQTKMGRKLFDLLANKWPVDWYLAVGSLGGSTVGETSAAKKDAKTGNYSFDAASGVYAATFNGKMTNTQSSRAEGTIVSSLAVILFQDFKGAAGGYIASASSRMAELLFHEGIHVLFAGGNNQEHFNMGLIQYTDSKKGYFLLKGGTLDRFITELSGVYTKLLEKATEDGDEDLIKRYEGNVKEINEMKSHEVGAGEFARRRQSFKQDDKRALPQTPQKKFTRKKW